MSSHQAIPTKRIGLFYDGVTFKMVSDYYLHHHGRQARPSFRGLNAFLEGHLAQTCGACSISEAHYFIGVEAG
jgi:hypothetical protein